MPLHLQALSENGDVVGVWIWGRVSNVRRKACPYFIEIEMLIVILC